MLLQKSIKILSPRNHIQVYRYADEQMDSDFNKRFVGVRTRLEWTWDSEPNASDLEYDTRMTIWFELWSETDFVTRAEFFNFLNYNKHKHFMGLLHMMSLYSKECS